VIGLDTNVLVRYVMQDDPRQSPRATRLMDSLAPQAPGYVSLVVLVELVWVLRGNYGLARGQVATVLETLLRSKELLVERAESVAQALQRFESAGADLADALIERIAAASGCEATYTFDAGAVKGANMTLVP
jgi:predicted nucleic-acid-binding protein